jgi:hypothetical protein
MLKPGRGFGFGLKSGGRPSIGISIGANDLHGYNALEADLPSLEDRTHTAAAELTQDPEARGDESRRAGRRRAFPIAVSGIGAERCRRRRVQ